MGYGATPHENPLSRSVPGDVLTASPARPLSPRRAAFDLARRFAAFDLARCSFAGGGLRPGTVPASRHEKQFPPLIWRCYHFGTFCPSGGSMAYAIRPTPAGLGKSHAAHAQHQKWRSPHSPRKTGGPLASLQLQLESTHAVIVPKHLAVRIRVWPSLIQIHV